MSKHWLLRGNGHGLGQFLLLGSVTTAKVCVCCRPFNESSGAVQGVMFRGMMVSRLCGLMCCNSQESAFCRRRWHRQIGATSRQLLPPLRSSFKAGESFQLQSGRTGRRGRSARAN
ncbi:unnamed protein product [Prorocentrum cordatum]|uniref:Secreted protein n=1 Tax=Prorocentrum cordatum TaxID=2364126 RepID=A0ABN9UVA2_9DINO|nr:unnamed protein product [Polarella glacialis]